MTRCKRRRKERREARIVTAAGIAAVRGVGIATARCDAAEWERVDAAEALHRPRARRRAERRQPASSLAASPSASSKRNLIMPAAAPVSLLPAQLARRGSSFLLQVYRTHFHSSMYFFSLVDIAPSVMSYRRSEMDRLRRAGADYEVGVSPARGSGEVGADSPSSMTYRERRSARRKSRQQERKSELGNGHTAAAASSAYGGIPWGSLDDDAAIYLPQKGESVCVLDYFRRCALRYFFLERPCLSMIGIS